MYLLVRSPFGLTLQGIRDSESRMQSLGYNVWLHKYLAFVISALFAGCAGVMSGYYDLATPYFATDYTVDHMQLDPELRQNLQVAYYEAGHMMYVRRQDHRKFREDYLALIERALATGE